LETVVIGYDKMHQVIQLTPTGERTIPSPQRPPKVQPPPAGQHPPVQQQPLPVAQPSPTND
jgi:hypothetical protein